MGNIYTQSPMQQGIFFHNMISKDNIYYDQVRFDIKGAFSADVFTKSIQVLINSHQALRSRYFYLMVISHSWKSWTAVSRR